jgi:hypothetical protein
MNGIQSRYSTCGLIPLFIVASTLAYADDLPTDPGANQPITPSYSSIDQQAALVSALSCSSPEALD